MTTFGCQDLLDIMSQEHDMPLDDAQVLISGLVELQSDDEDPEPSVVAVKRVAIAAELKTVVDQVLHDSVEAARASQVSWQQVGDILGISRQAAFQRFRNPDDPRGNEHMRTKTDNALIPRAEQIYHQLDSGNYESVGAEMTFVVQRVLTEKKVMGVWSQVKTMAGSLESIGESFVRPSGRNAVVVETPLSFEAADVIGRIAYNKRDKIVGMLILPAENIASAPF